MTNKEKYIAELRNQHPDDPEEFLEFCSVFHDYNKAKSYGDILYTCTTYADIANKVVRPMYISGDIDDIKAKSEKFLDLLIPFMSRHRGKRPCCRISCQTDAKNDKCRRRAQETRSRTS